MAALRGEVLPAKPDAFWQVRADAIRDAHAAAIPAAVDAQMHVVRLAGPHVSARQEADRARIVKLADELEMLIGRSTNYSTGTVVVDGFMPLGSIENMLRAIRTVGRSA